MAATHLKGEQFIPTFAPGLRFSRFDVAVLLMGSAAALGLSFIDKWTAIGTAFVVIHFFLFCNVFRISRALELSWAAVFALLVVSALVFGLISYPWALGLTTVVTVIVLTIESRRPSYHGIGWQTLNPELPAWWQAHVQATTKHSDGRTTR